MSTLIVQLPDAPRLSAQTPPARSEPGEVDFVYSADGLHATRHGRAALAELPRADSVVAVLGAADVSWHRVNVPKVPAAKLRAALFGVLEEALLDETGDAHLAVGPDWRAGEASWVAAVHKSWLTASLEALEHAGHPVDRAVAAWPPGAVPAGHFQAGTAPGQLALAWRDADGPLYLPLDSAAARELLSRQDGASGVRWTASPEAASRASELLGHAVAAVSPADFLFAAARAAGNLLQFDLAPQRRSGRRLRQAWQTFWVEPPWRQVRWGLATLLGLHLLGANAWAWQQRQTLAAQKTALADVLRGAFPQVRAVIDPWAQMQKEMQRLRAAAGRSDSADLEAMLFAVDSAWPASQPSAETLNFEPGHLTLTIGADWPAADLDALRSSLRAQGLAVEASADRLDIKRLAPS